MQTFKYLNLVDFSTSIQSGQLQYQLVQNNIQTIFRAEGYALEEVGSILSSKYDLSKEFIPVNAWKYGVTYSAGDRIILDYATFSEGLQYNLGDCVILPGVNDYDNLNFNLVGEAYCLTGTAGWTGSSIDNNWTSLGANYDFFNVAYPAPIFNYQLEYSKGDKVFFENQIWTCARNTPLLTETFKEQFVSINNVPRNVIPSDKINEHYGFWIPSGIIYSTPLAGLTSSVGYTYSIVDTLPTHKDFWNIGDNRSQMMVINIVHLVLFYVHQNIAPTNIPPLRVEAFKLSMEYFTDLAFGRKISYVLPLQPEDGSTIRFGGNVRVVSRW